MAAASENAIVEECSSLEAILGSELLICQTDPLLQIVVQVTADLLSGILFLFIPRVYSPKLQEKLNYI
jgi:hypothetical protein